MQNNSLAQQKPWYLQPWVWLLIALPAEEAEALVARLRERGVRDASVIGEFVPEHPGQIFISPRA